MTDPRNSLPTYRGINIETKKLVEGTGYTDFLNISRDFPKYAGDGRMWIWSDYSWVEVEPDSIAIHFPNMIAEKSTKKLPNGNPDLRIFAGFNENGKGADIVKWHFGGDLRTEPLIHRGGYCTIFYMNLYEEYEVVGVKED